ncbi:hypothetical protein EVAR_62618_1 [Eumeta japonica]|uniref:Uncharacterized protein n=1 Tax=Eumeta variegata TaxID=151549 RepID=A0A4C1ZA11_EUMVA|nr:hypothetical protein EVAR_62618_1 [Eumeta japonica]
MKEHFYVHANEAAADGLNVSGTLIRHTLVQISETLQVDPSKHLSGWPPNRMIQSRLRVRRYLEIACAAHPNRPRPLRNAEPNMRRRPGRLPSFRGVEYPKKSEDELWQWGVMHSGYEYPAVGSGAAFGTPERRCPVSLRRLLE